MLISATKLSCCFIVKAFSSFLPVRKAQEEGEGRKGGRKRKNGTSKPVARTRRNMKVDLLESGKEEVRTRERNSGTVLTSWMEQARAGPPDNEAVVQEQCRSVGQNTRDIETTGNWASGTSPLLSSSYSSYIPLTVIYVSPGGPSDDIVYLLSAVFPSPILSRKKWWILSTQCYFELLLLGH